MLALERPTLLNIHSVRSFCRSNDQSHLGGDDMRSWSPTLSDVSAQSSSATGDEEIDNQFNSEAPALIINPSRDHYEFWDVRSQDHLWMSGSLYIASDHWTHDSGAYLQFSHVELEIRTHGRQGRFSRENLWRPAYVDYASTPITAPTAQHLTRTKDRSLVSFARLDDRSSEAMRIGYKIGIPQELFRSMNTRSIRITCRAIFTEWKDNAVVSAEVVEADPVCVTVSQLQMRDYLSSVRWRGAANRCSAGPWA
ncbi:hypothetical protein FRB96_007484 [Tulasnella sp. 330]|nr:hypothetical protein FRB96_007484 [Tulasnella sp. 330]KAG8881549.1 hypothetical protein FRB97_009383 [Tulasnella sp. 331]KAG8887537.1 hypothetical protein FRB98_009443 [Tulasnella sp. 332]